MCCSTSEQEKDGHVLRGYEIGLSIWSDVKQIDHATQSSGASEHMRRISN